MQDFRKLDVWTKSHELAIDVHRTLSKQKRIESGTRSQLNRAAQSIPANIAEGCGRSTSAELARYADQAIGSATELEYHLLLTHDLGSLPKPDKPDFERLTANAVQVRRMLFGLRKAVKNRGNGGH